MATNVLESPQLGLDEMIVEYKEQQSAERGFGFLKDPLFFTDSVFLKSSERIEALALVMGLCLLVYTLGQRLLGDQLKFLYIIDRTRAQKGKGISSEEMRNWVETEFSED